MSWNCREVFDCGKRNGVRIGVGSKGCGEEKGKTKVPGREKKSGEERRGKTRGRRSVEGKGPPTELVKVKT
jgi:hypothetical protein